MLTCNLRPPLSLYDNARTVTTVTTMRKKGKRKEQGAGNGKRAKKI
jgi:hypothetical protein